MTSSTMTERPPDHRPDTGGISVGTPGEMSAIGRQVAKALRPGDLIAVSGPLGAGKTHLCRAVIRGLIGNPEAAVPSPSYTLVNVYETPSGQIWHADFYRLSDPGEFDELGLEDATDAIILAEWPERWDPLPERRAELRITPLSDNRREISLFLSGPGWEALAKTWETLK